MSAGLDVTAAALRQMLEQRLQPVLKARKLKPIDGWRHSPAFVERPDKIPLLVIHGGRIAGLTRSESRLLDMTAGFTITLLQRGKDDDSTSQGAWAYSTALVEVLTHYRLVVDGRLCPLSVASVTPAGGIDPADSRTLAGCEVMVALTVPEAFDPSVDPLTGPIALPTAETLTVDSALLDLEVS